ncbi:Hypothetical_protein [Hexamita inflata]|uniref:Hypothetical_protein n=1 Tax=Hexamita inflata TaxID=28002 RepID=A0AA86QTH8_9EUKA|nr:Hypothetical protein HINF_LOCUS52025 [Hexamita inflata]
MQKRTFQLQIVRQAIYRIKLIIQVVEQVIVIHKLWAVIVVGSTFRKYVQTERAQGFQQHMQGVDKVILHYIRYEAKLFQIRLFNMRIVRLLKQQLTRPKFMIICSSFSSCANVRICAASVDIWPSLKRCITQFDPQSNFRELILYIIVYHAALDHERRSTGIPRYQQLYITMRYAILFALRGNVAALELLCYVDQIENITSCCLYLANALFEL